MTYILRINAYLDEKESIGLIKYWKHLFIPGASLGLLIQTSLTIARSVLLPEFKKILNSDAVKLSLGSSPGTVVLRWDGDVLE